MATSRISNTIKSPNGTAIAGVPVTALLMPSAGFRISDFTEVARIVSTTTDASGFWQLDLERNSNVTPSNSWYEVIEGVPNASGGRRVWNIAVGASDQSLLASLVTPAQQQPTVVPAGTTYLDQAAADARYQALGSLGATTPVRIDPDDAGTAGVSSSASRQDHEHPITTGAPVSIVLTGTNAEGSGTGFARDTHQHAYSPPSCRVTHNTTQSIPDNTLTTVAFNAERYDPLGMHDTAVSNSRIVLPTAGVYVIHFGGVFVAAADYVSIRALILKNGATIIEVGNEVGTYTDTTHDPNFGVTTVDKFAANDFIEVQVQHNNTANVARNLLSFSSFTPDFSATWIGVG